MKTILWLAHLVESFAGMPDIVPSPVNGNMVLLVTYQHRHGVIDGATEAIELDATSRTGKPLM